MCVRVRVCLISSFPKQRNFADSLLQPVISQSSCKNYCQSYILVYLKRSHCCLVYPLRAGQEVKKAEVITKCHHNFEQSIYNKIHAMHTLKIAQKV